MRPLPKSLKATELMAIASSPVPRMKLFVAVRSLPTVPSRDTLLRLSPSAQMDVSRLLRAVPPVPEAQNPDRTCWLQMLSATQLVPVVSIAPPAPPEVSRLVALASRWKFSTVHEVTEKMAPRPELFGSGTAR